MQGPWGGEMPQGMDSYEQMVNTFAENTKMFWRMWGPTGEPMVRGVEAWAEMQRAYIQWLIPILSNSGAHYGLPACVGSDSSISRSHRQPHKLLTRSGSARSSSR